MFARNKEGGKIGGKDSVEIGNMITSSGTYSLAGTVNKKSQSRFSGMF